MTEPGLRATLDLSVYLVTDTVMAGGRGVAAVAAQAVAGGATLVQVRDPHADDATFTRIARDVVSAVAGTGVPVLLNDRVHLVHEVGAHGAHVGQSDMPVRQARELLGDEAILGLSIADPAQLDAAFAAGPVTLLDYIGVGPLRGTATKPGHAPPLGLDALAQITARSPWPGVAIGGVTAADAAAVREAGAHGLCVVSAVMAAVDPRAAARALADAWHATEH